MDKDQKTAEDTTKKIIEIDDTQVRGHLRELVRGSVEETLNGLLDAEADALCGAKRYERNPERVDTRAGSYKRGLDTQAGKDQYWTLPNKKKKPVHRNERALKRRKAS